MKNDLTPVGWCVTRGQYADDLCAKDVECRGEPHDHYDVVIDYSGEGQGKVLYRLDPVGTMYLLSDGATLRLTRYDDDVWAEPSIDDQIVPLYDYWSPNGGASSGDRSAWRSIWNGAILASGVSRTVVVPDNPERPAVGSTYVRPDGEVWRLRNYRLDMANVGPEGESLFLPSWEVMLPARGFTNGETLPADARLIWHP